MKAERRRSIRIASLSQREGMDKNNVHWLIQTAAMVKREIQQSLNENRNDPHQEMLLHTGQHPLIGDPEQL